MDVPRSIDQPARGPDVAFVPGVVAGVRDRGHNESGGSKRKRGVGMTRCQPAVTVRDDDERQAAPSYGSFGCDLLCRGADDTHSRRRIGRVPDVDPEGLVLRILYRNFREANRMLWRRGLEIERRNRADHQQSQRDQEACADFECEFHARCAAIPLAWSRDSVRRR
jgi:hypothetical protein